MLSDCYTTCGDLECWRGDDKHPFLSLVVPKNISVDNAKNLCIFYNSNKYRIINVGVDSNKCNGCQIYVDIYKFESSSPTL